MWSDPNNSSDTWGVNSRGISCTYNSNAVDIFLNNNNLQIVPGTPGPLGPTMTTMSCMMTLSMYSSP